MFWRRACWNQKSVQKVKNKLEHSKATCQRRWGKFQTQNKLADQTVPLTNPEVKGVPKTKSKQAQHTDESIEVMEIEQVTIKDIEDEDAAQFAKQIIANKLRGFRKTDNPAEQQKPSLKKYVSFETVPCINNIWTCFASMWTFFLHKEWGMKLRVVLMTKL